MRAKTKKSFTVKRIVANIHAEDLAAARRFYGSVFGLEPIMHLGWIVTYGSQHKKMGIQVSIGTQGGSGTPTPDISIEVDDIDAALKGVRKEVTIPTPLPTLAYLKIFLNNLFVLI